MTAIAIDDEPLALEVVRSHASKVPFMELKETFTDAFLAMDYLQRSPVDLLFLDIKMPDISGIEFMKSLNRKPMVIFTTAYSEHAVASFELDAIDYLLKPFPLARFLKACTKAHELYQLRNSTKNLDYIFIKTGYELAKVRFADIMYVEAEGNYVSFVMTDKKILSRMTFTETEALLPAVTFIRIHRSYIVSIDHIERADKSQVFIQGKSIPVGESYQQKLSMLK